CAPFPYVAHAILASAEDDVVLDGIEGRAHHLVRLQELIVAGMGSDLAVAAPVVFQVIKAPLGVAPRILFLVLEAALMAGAGLRAGRRIQSNLEAFAVDIGGKGFHVREFLVREHIAIGIAARSRRVTTSSS